MLLAVLTITLMRVQQGKQMSEEFLLVPEQRVDDKAPDKNILANLQNSQEVERPFAELISESKSVSKVNAPIVELVPSVSASITPVLKVALPISILVVSNSKPSSSPNRTPDSKSILPCSSTNPDPDESKITYAVL